MSFTVLLSYCDGFVLLIKDTNAELELERGGLYGIHDENQDHVSILTYSMSCCMLGQWLSLGCCGSENATELIGSL